MKPPPQNVVRSPASAPDAGRIWRRAASPFDQQLLIATVAWMRKLPRAILPIATAHRFPRILNGLARSWNAPRMLDAMFEELLHDERGNRQGFPMEIYSEILQLHSYHFWLQSKRATRRALGKSARTAVTPPT
jgi:hypothetical protein